MLSSKDEEKYYLNIFEKLEKKSRKDPNCDELTVLASELNLLLPRIKKTSPSDPSYTECWDKVITGTKFLLALHHEKRGTCF